jgi:prefoldin subunit 5
MAEKSMASYSRANPPSDLESYKRYIEEELRKIEQAIRDIEAAVVQLQTSVTAATTFPIVLT